LHKKPEQIDFLGENLNNFFFIFYLFYITKLFYFQELEFVRMVRVSVLNDALKSMYIAEKRGKQQVSDFFCILIILYIYYF
jgi:hypothetical protein